MNGMAWEDWKNLLWGIHSTLQCLFTCCGEYRESVAVIGGRLIGLDLKHMARMSLPFSIHGKQE